MGTKPIEFVAGVWERPMNNEQTKLMIEAFLSRSRLKSKELSEILEIEEWAIHRSISILSHAFIRGLILKRSEAERLIIHLENPSIQTCPLFLE